MSRSTEPTSRASSSDCRSCGGCVDRRGFLRTGLGIAGVAALASMLPSALSATPIRWTASLGTTADRRVRYPIPESDGVEVDRGNEVILVRQGTRVMAFALSCPHQRSMLRWREDDGIFQCTKHRSEYDPTGVYQKGRATRNMDRLAIGLEAGEVVIDPSVTFHSDDDPEGWAAASVELP